MKKTFTLATLILALVLTTAVSAQEFSGIDKSPMDMAAYPTDYKVSEKAVRILFFIYYTW